LKKLDFDSHVRDYHNDRKQRKIGNPQQVDIKKAPQKK